MLVVLLAISRSVEAQERLRIQRGSAPPAVKKSNDKPLTGAVEMNARDNLVDPSDFQPLSGTADSSRLNAGAARGNLQGLVDTNAFPSLRGGTATVDLNKPFPLSSNANRLRGDISDEEWRLLRSRDVVIIQDRSRSMTRPEMFPSGVSTPWAWCRQQAQDLTRQAGSDKDWAVTLMLFARDYEVYPRVTLSQIPAIFSDSRISLGTNIAPPLNEVFSDYFRRSASGGARPLLIAIITDGKPHDEAMAAQLIINATHQMRNPDDIRITVLQVGRGGKAKHKLAFLDNLASMGARYDIVRVRGFEEVTRNGLTRSLVNTIKDAFGYRR